MPEDATIPSDAARAPLICPLLTAEQVWLLQTLAGASGQWAIVPPEHLLVARELIALEVVRLLELPDGQGIHHVTPLGMQVVALLTQAEGQGKDA